MTTLAGASKEALRSELLELGFDEARFTDLSPLSGTRLREWVELGYHADMEWLKNSVEKRLNPELVLDGTCSVIMLGINYYPADEFAQNQKRWGKYSLYQDYHDTVLKGVKLAGAMLEEKYGLGQREYRYYVDTGPVMERGWAAASGMGWQGKNGMLISQKHGNWLLLATILTKLEIEPDLPLKKRNSGEDAKPELALLCGKCTRCIDACPTDAIVEPGMINANRCISYQTIENKGIIPREFRKAIGSRLFGCDICLDVCPWNRFAESGRLMLLSQRYDIAKLSLLEILEMDIETFREVFRKMPIKRLKLRGLLRNACIVAGNLAEHDEWREEGFDGEWIERVVAALVRLAIHEEAIVRAAAVWAVYELKGAEAKEFLNEAKEWEDDAEVLEEYEQAELACDG